jgi:predicted 3-demethylubiquinone-9 3-methyltransferase (glyoxalase superfamily)
MIHKITPFLWFDTQAEEAAQLYVSIFQNSKIGTVTRYNEASAKMSGRPTGSAMTVSFTLNGQDFTAINGGPIFKLTEAFSLVVPCDTQDEIDACWNKLTADGGMEVQCGWLKDKYGLSWQIVPSGLDKWMSDPKRAAAVMQAMLPMKKIDIATLQRAFDSN